jgi:hypothetical protein
VPYDGSFPFHALVEPRARGVVVLFESHVNFEYRGLNLGIVFPDGSTEPIGLLHEGQGAFVVGAVGHP